MTKNDKNGKKMTKICPAPSTWMDGVYRVVRWAMRGFDAADSERTVRRESPTSPPTTSLHSQPTKTAGRVGRAKKLPHSPPKGALTSTKPLLVNARPTGETCAKNFADTCYTASGPRAGTNATEPLKKPHCITRGLKQSCKTRLATRQNGPAGQDLLHDWNGSASDKA